MMTPPYPPLIGEGKVRFLPLLGGELKRGLQKEWQRFTPVHKYARVSNNIIQRLTS